MDNCLCPAVRVLESAQRSSNVSFGKKCFYYAAYLYDRRQQQVQGVYSACQQRGQGVDPDQQAQAAKRPRIGTLHNAADQRTFIRSWQGLPWILVPHSVGTFVGCGLCDYLKLLIDRCSRADQALREVYRDRLGVHYMFQGAQRLAQGQLEEDCAQSEGRKWFGKFDKMDNKKVVCPTIASQLATPFFKVLSLRLVTGILGSMWHGTRTCQHHIRTLFDDCGHGSNMQISGILMNLFDVATSEGYLPEEFSIGADNTYKETKNQYTVWFAVWLLCVLEGTPLAKVAF